jgi:cyclopropane-fatty-acyl-phospholipid synthase
MRVTSPLRDALARALPERPFRLELWDGSSLPPTNGTGGPTVRVRSPRALGHVLRAPGQLGLGRAYVSGDIEVDDIDAVLELLDGYVVPPLDGARGGDAIAVSGTGERLHTITTSRTSSSGWF